MASAETAGRARVCMMVANDVVHDSRVQKIAYSVAGTGAQVLLLGYDAALRCPVKAPAIGAARVVLTGLGKLSYRYRLRRRMLRIARPPGATGSGVKERITTLLWLAWVRDGDWRRTAPHLPALERAWAPFVAEFGPDLIHAHDVHTPGIAVRIAERLPRRPRVIYDAHEFVAGLTNLPPARQLAYTSLETEYIRRVNAVITVSTQLAEALVDAYRLPMIPAVVTNAPLRHPPHRPQGTVLGLRVALRLDEEVPLLVYSGRVAPIRGVHTMIEALPLLPDVHAAVVCDTHNPCAQELTRLAVELRVADRLHLVGYVPYDQVSEFLASATIGVVPLLPMPNHELALATKYYEYMHAGLPVVVSDIGQMAATTRELGNGQVFVAGNPASLAEAVEKVLADPPDYRNSYTNELLAAHSWETQAERLVKVYSAQLGHFP